MDEERARALIRAERARVESLLGESAVAAEIDRSEQGEPADVVDVADRVMAEGVDDAVVSGLRARLQALDRAEERLQQGRYGRSVLSGLPIPDERLEADPAAELTTEESEASRRP
jgi:DnaK suppressor protein